MDKLKPSTCLIRSVRVGRRCLSCGMAVIEECALERVFSVELLLAGASIERVSILRTPKRITEKHYAPWVRARQEQLQADVRRSWATFEPKRRAHGGYTEKRAPVIPFKSGK